MIFTCRWQWAEICPSWARWLPCSVHHLRIVPHPYMFPRRVWDDGPEPFDWDAPAWCDPGDPDDWIARAVARHAHDDEDLAVQHAREHYDNAVKIRGARIVVFTAMCHRAGATPPSTLAHLLDCLLQFGLYRQEETGGQAWLLPRLWRNPLDVLPLTADEAAAEARRQHREQAMLVGAGLRRLTLAASPPAPLAETAAVTATLRAVADHANVHAGQVRAAIALLATDDLVDPGDADLDNVDLDTSVKFTLRWTHLDRGFDFEELPPPEHL